MEEKIWNGKVIKGEILKAFYLRLRLGYETSYLHFY